LAYKVVGLPELGQLGIFEKNKKHRIATPATHKKIKQHPITATGAMSRSTITSKPPINIDLAPNKKVVETPKELTEFSLITSKDMCEIQKQANKLLTGLELAYPNHVEVKRLGVETALKNQHLDEARLALRDLVVEYPSDIRFWKALAIIYLEEADWQSAISALEKARKISPANTVVLSNLGGAYFFLGEFEQAKSVFLNSLKIQREPWIINNLGTIHYFEHDYESALDYFFEYLKLNQEDHVVYASIADTLLQLNDNVRAKDYYRKALEKALLLSHVDTGADLKANIAYYRARLGEHKLVGELLLDIDLKQITSDGAYFSALAAHVIENESSRTEFVRLAIEKGYPDFLITKDPILKIKDL
jgi:Flp pilus assembly protein TadD